MNQFNNPPHLPRLDPPHGELVEGDEYGWSVAQWIGAAAVLALALLACFVGAMIVVAMVVSYLQS